MEEGVKREKKNSIGFISFIIFRILYGENEKYINDVRKVKIKVVYE